MKKHILFLLAFVVLAVGCTKDDFISPSEAPSDDAQLKSTMHVKTIKTIKASGTISITGPCTPPYMQVYIEGEGNASHLGHFTVTNTVCLNLTTFEQDGDWLGFITAANGDQLFTKMVNGPYFPAGSTVPYYDYEVLGGTGRFEEVTGGMLVNWGITDMATGTWELEGLGTIIFNGP